MINKINISRDLALLITRVIVGGIFVYSGWIKVSDIVSTVAMFGSMGIVAPLAYIVSYGEILGGAMVILGLWIELASVFLSILMIAAVYLTRTLGFQAYGLPLSMLGGLVAILGCGAGSYTINQKSKEHYICLGGCRGVSKVPGVCKVPSCAHYNHPLMKE